MVSQSILILKSYQTERINKSFYKGRNPYKLNKNPSDKIIKLILNLKKNKSKKYLKNFVDII